MGGGSGLVSPDDIRHYHRFPQIDPLVYLVLTVFLVRFQLIPSWMLPGNPNTIQDQFEGDFVLQWGGRRTACSVPPDIMKAHIEIG